MMARRRAGAHIIIYELSLFHASRKHSYESEPNRKSDVARFLSSRDCRDRAARTEHLADGGCDEDTAEAAACAAGDAGEAGGAHSLLPEVDSRRAWAGRADYEFDRVEVRSEWQDDSLAARSAGYFHVSCCCAGGREPAQCELRLHRAE